MSIVLRKVEKDAPWRWLGQGWADIWRAPVLSLAIGAVFVLIGLAITAGLWRIGMLAVAPVALAGFALVAPAFAVAFYQISRRLDAGAKPAFADVFTLSGSKMSQIALLSFILVLLFLMWARIAQFLYAGFVQGDYRPPGELIQFVLTDPGGMMLVVSGTIIGAALALAAFSISVLSFPLLLDRDIDAVTAVIASVRAVATQPFVMLVWAWLIAFMVLAGSALFIVGLAVVFPWLGHTSWRAYRDFVFETPESSAALAAS